MPETAARRRRILWVDDEIDLLRSHRIFLSERGYDVTPATNGDDALALVAGENYDIVLLDEMMPGMDGLSTLDEIKSLQPTLPVIMVTKSEEEQLMNEAIGKRIDDYLVKPVNPSQIVMACKRILDARQIRAQRMMRDYVTEFQDLDSIMSNAGWSDWIDLFTRLAHWDLEIHSHHDQSVAEMFHTQWRNCNRVFARFIENSYPGWLADPNTGPIMSPDVVRQFVTPHLGSDRRVYFIVIDCLRLDQWLVIEPLVAEFFNVRRETYFSIVPTATPYSRNALFSGQFPAEMAKTYPELWASGDDDDLSLNRHEARMLSGQLGRLGLGNTTSRYEKIVGVDEGRSLGKRMGAWKSLDLVAMVFNFIDNLSHGRSESDILQKITPDEASFRSLTVAWFAHSPLFDILQWISSTDATVIITTDHGSVLSSRATLARGNRDISTNLRYKYGLNLFCDQKEAVLVKDPTNWGLPPVSPSTNFIIAKEDFYFVYPTRYHKYDRQYRNSFQHGGISLEEMIVPVVTLTPRG